jgi:1-acyl-sn-glycerol-3-phosphate acyltransferase
MLPIVISWIWTVGIMGLLGISFNIFNVIILTFVFGLGIDYSIFVMRGLIQGYKYGITDLSSYKVSVILSVFTTILGIGVLIFAKHPALRSIATMSIIGIVTVVFVTFTTLPGIFKWMVTYKKGLRNRPVTLLDLVFSIISLFVFIGGALIMSLFSLILEIVPVKKQKKKWVFHVIFSKLTWFLLYLNIFSPKKIINPHNEDFKKPAVIIANHQSHIDLMLLMLLNPRILIVSNARNYYHPVHGRAIRYADFIPHDVGYEKMAEMAAEKVREGYSIMIFPEGHRSDTGEIKRFHKGAFELAKTLKIDVLPIIIYGQYQCLKKSEFFLKRCSVITKILPRIDLTSNEFGASSKEQAKTVQSYFKKDRSFVPRGRPFRLHDPC